MRELPIKYILPQSFSIRPPQQFLSTGVVSLKGEEGERSRGSGERNTLPNCLRSPQGTCGPGSRLHNNAHFEEGRRRRKMFKSSDQYTSASLPQRKL